MNVNTSKLIPYNDEITCDKTDWQAKFKTQSWKDCEAWLYSLYYWFFTDQIAQVYVFEGSQIPYVPNCGRYVSSTFKFPLYTKYYDTSNLTNFDFNNVEVRSIEDKKCFVSSKELTLKQPVSNKLVFYLNTDIKIKKDYILNKVRTIYFAPTEFNYPKMNFNICLCSRSWTDFIHREWSDREVWIDNFQPMCGATAIEKDIWYYWNTWEDYDIWV